MPKRKETSSVCVSFPSYDDFVCEISALLESARAHTARSVNAILTATYWEVGRCIVEYEQAGEARAEYGTSLLKQLSKDLIHRFGRGFSVDNLETMRLFYTAYPPSKISETVSRKSPDYMKSDTSSRILHLSEPTSVFPLSWSHYVLLVRHSRSDQARSFYESEALRGGWSVRQLRRQMDSQFYERTALSRDKAAVLENEAKKLGNDTVPPEVEIKDPYVLEFLDLKDEYSESELEETLIRHLETFLLELGSDFAFLARQKRLRIGTEWYRVDLLFFHRGLRCLVLIDLKLGRFTHADAGQMHVYLNYAREHWTRPDENPPVGLILCAEKDSALAKYALEGLPNKVLTSEYRTVLPDEELLADEVIRTRQKIDRKGRQASERS